LRNPDRPPYPLAFFAGLEYANVAIEQTRTDGARMLQNDCLNVGEPMHHGWGRALQHAHPDVSHAVSCGCGSFRFHLVRIEDDPELSVVCDTCLSFITGD